LRDKQFEIENLKKSIKLGAADEELEIEGRPKNELLND